MAKIETKPYASFSLRFGIRFIDYFCLFLCIGLGNVFSEPLCILVLVLSLFNRVYLLGTRGYTLGSKISGVVFLGKDFKPIGVVGAFVRETFQFLSAFPLYLGFLWMLWDEHRETWHDKLVGSRVYRKEALELLLTQKGEQLAQSDDKTSAEYLTLWEKFLMWFRQRFVASSSPSTPPLTDSGKENKQSTEMPSVGKKFMRWVRQQDTGYGCPECGGDLRKEQKYCPNCGSAIDWSE